MKKTYLAYFILGIFTSFLTCSQGPANEERATASSPNPSPIFYDLENLSQAIDALEKDSLFRHGSLAFSLQSVKDASILLEQNAQKTLNVASCLKAVTTATALGILGADYTFKTYLEYDGAIKGNVLEGNLYIRGTGDPVLGSTLLKKASLNAVLNNWAQKIKSLGIQEIKGAILADEDAFSGDLSPSHWIWGDMGNYFGAPAGAINVLDNTYKLYFRPGSVGKAAEIVKTEPAIANVQFINEVKTAPAGTGDQASISGAPYDPVRYVTGTIPQGGLFSIKGSIPDPAHFLSQALHTQLKKLGCQIQKKPSTTRQWKLSQKAYPSTKNRQMIYTHSSPSLQEIVNYTNLYSINLFAEALLKQIGLKVKKEASTQAGTKAITEYWQEKGLDIGGFYMQDGSGLAFANGITAQQLSHIMYLTSQEPYFNTFFQSLPVSGQSGTMYTVAAGTLAQGNLRAKTGGMTRVLAYTGYFRTRRNEIMAFSLIANQYTCSYREMKKRLGDLMVKMVSI